MNNIMTEAIIWDTSCWIEHESIMTIDSMIFPSFYDSIMSSHVTDIANYSEITKNPVAPVAIAASFPEANIIAPIEKYEKNSKLFDSLPFCPSSTLPSSSLPYSLPLIPSCDSIEKNEKTRLESSLLDIIKTPLVSSKNNDGIIPIPIPIPTPPIKVDKVVIKRERNRLAAEKCRQKKTKLIEELQKECDQLKMDKAELEIRNQQLLNIINNLMMK